MRTSQDVRNSGRYISECCGEVRIFREGDTFWRCPQCEHLCDWTLMQILVFEEEQLIA
jgi:hypothetical protein